MNRRSVHQTTAVGAMDADVISLKAPTTYRYPNEIGPAVYEMHAPRLPTVSEMADLLGKAGEKLAADQI